MMEFFQKKRKWIGIEKEKKYITEAISRINLTQIESIENLGIMVSKKSEPRIPFGTLLEKGLISPGEILFDGRKRWFAKVRIDGSVISNNEKGSIHSVGAKVQGLNACNGWTFWHTDYKGSIVQIDTLRTIVRDNLGLQ